MCEKVFPSSCRNSLNTFGCCTKWWTLLHPCLSNEPLKDAPFIPNHDTRMCYQLVYLWNVTNSCFWASKTFRVFSFFYPKWFWMTCLLLLWLIFCFTWCYHDGVCAHKHTLQLKKVSSKLNIYSYVSIILLKPLVLCSLWDYLVFLKNPLMCFWTFFKDFL